MKLKKLISSILPAVFILLFSLNAFSFNESDENTQTKGFKFAEIYLILFLIILGAVIGRRFLAKKFNQPEVLGELMIGVLLGVILYQMNNPVMFLLRHQDKVNEIVQSGVSGNK